MKRRTLLEAGSKPIDPTTGRGIVDGYEVVDLGLPSGLLWATCNVGADTEKNYGNYYMYGKGATLYNENDSYYTGTENPLNNSLDTATQVMGSDWHMPTLQEFQELANNTTNVSTTINGVKGGKFTSKTNPNAYVFFPSAGYYESGRLRGSGTVTYIWTSTPIDATYAKRIFYNTSYDTNGSARYYGMSIRGVHATLA